MLPIFCMRFLGFLILENMVKLILFIYFFSLMEGDNVTSLTNITIGHAHKHKYELYEVSFEHSQKLTFIWANGVYCSQKYSFIF